MNISTQIDGERIFKDVIAQTSALEVIKERQKRLLWQWSYWLPVLLSVACYILASSLTGVQYILGIALSLVLGIAVAAFMACLNLRRRLDAAIILLLKHEANPSFKRDA